VVRRPFAAAVHFSPKGGCTDAVVGELRKARNEILLQAYSFTSKPIAEALVEAKGRGVHIDLLLDRSNEHETHSELSDLLGQGLTPLIDAHHAIAHNKLIIIDGHTVITGSFNFTNQAEHENAENLLIFTGHPELVRAYRQNFLEHKSHCEPAQQARPAAPARARRREVRAEGKEAASAVVRFFLVLGVEFGVARSVLARRPELIGEEVHQPGSAEAEAHQTEGGVGLLVPGTKSLIDGPDLFEGVRRRRRRIGDFDDGRTLEFQLPLRRRDEGEKFFRHRCASERAIHFPLLSYRLASPHARTSAKVR